MPGPLSAETLKAYADPTYLSKPVPTAAQGGTPNYMHRVGLPVAIGGQAADILTTLLALQRPGVTEGNDRVYGARPSAAKLAGLTAAVDGPLLLLLDRMHDKAPAGSGWRKAALLAALGMGGAGIGAAIHNTGVK